MNTRLTAITAFVLLSCANGLKAGDEAPALQQQTIAAIKKAAAFYHAKVATQGGYVYYYSVDLNQRWGEGVASATQIWVQPPGTPTVGMAYLKAYQATGDSTYLQAAKDAANALIYGQLRSGGWTNSIDFNPRGKVALYRNGKGRGRNVSSLDDGQTQSAIQLLIHVDKALSFKDNKIHEAAQIALDALLKAQFANGGFPQVWREPVSRQPIIKASFPNYDWRTEERIKNYWDMYTLNDNVSGYVADTLIDAHHIYKGKKYYQALEKLGDFLLLAQMPQPQPAWAQQYNYKMKPIWARRFEPPGISGDESQEVMETLMKIYRITGDKKYLQPIPSALAYLKRSLLPDGRLARYYELKTNRPLYMKRRGREYTLTYDDSDLPSHYGWKTVSRLGQIEKAFADLKKNGKSPPPRPSPAKLQQQVQKIVRSLDSQGRWISTAKGERLVGQPKFRPGTRYISSEVFSRNLETISAYLTATRNKE